MYITDIVYLLDVLVVIVYILYMSYCNCWDYLLLHEDWGECYEDWARACRWGGGEVEFLTEKKIPLRNVKNFINLWPDFNTYRPATNNYYYNSQFNYPK